MYIENFKSLDDVATSYDIPSDALKGAEVLLAWYGYGSYCGTSLVVFREHGKLYEVNGSHCSCYGLEGQWEPEETSPQALLRRAMGLLAGDYYDGEREAGRLLKQLATTLGTQA